MKDCPSPIFDVTLLEEFSSSQELSVYDGWTASMPPLKVTILGGEAASLSVFHQAVTTVITTRLTEGPFPIRRQEGDPRRLTAAFHDLLRVADELSHEHPPGPTLAEALQDALPPVSLAPRILTSRGELRFDGPPLLMGILNITPDSFSDGGLYLDPGAALDRAWQLVEEGADILDLGAESTRPGSEPVPADEELARLLPVLTELAPDCPVPISVDTYKAEVAEAALGEGADIVNDISGFTFEPSLASVVARHRTPVILMHVRGRPGTMQNDPRYQWLVAEVLERLAISISRASEAGIPKEKCLIDPGLGFGKTFAHNEQLIEAIPTLRKVGQPVVVGPSRKAFIREKWGASPEALAKGTASVCRRAAVLGASVLRVHDVAMVRHALEECMRESNHVLKDDIICDHC